MRFTRIVNIIFLVQFLHYNLVQFALLQSIFLFSQFAFEIPSGVLSDILKRKTIILAGLFILTASLLVMLTTLMVTKAIGFGFLVLAFVMEGIGNALLSGADDALFYEAIRYEGSEAAYGQIRGRGQFINALSLGIATFIGGFLYSHGVSLPYLLQAGMVFAALILIVTMKDVNVKNIEEQPRQSMSAILSVFKEMTTSANILFMFGFTTLIAAMVDGIFALLPDYVSKIGFSSSQNGAIFMIISFFGGLVATQAYRLAKVGYRTMIVIVSAVLLVGMLFQIQTNSYLFLIGIGLLYIVEDILDPVVMQMFNLWVKDEARATFMSGLSFCVTLMTMILNPIMGFVIQRFGTVNLLIVASLSTIVLVVIADLLMRKSKIRN
nr:MFS transporter [Secundilactobacillus oryzae]